MTLTKQNLSSDPILYQGFQSCLDLLLPEKHALPAQFETCKQPTGKSLPNQSRWSVGEVCLSRRSLEMCTELLGNENGSYIDPDKDEYSYLLWDRMSTCMNEQTIPTKVSKKKEVSSNFPPPLTSISGNDAVRVHTHREGGRLIIKVSTLASSSSGLQSERKNGRLVLSLPVDEEHELVEDEEEVEAVKMVGMEKDCSSAAFNGRLWHENPKRKLGRFLCRIESCSGCNGDDRVSKRQQSVISCG